MYSKTKIRLKYTLGWILKSRKTIEKANNFFYLKWFEFLTESQYYQLERELMNRHCLVVAEKGGEWDYDAGKFRKTKFVVDWNAVDCEYYGWLKDTPYVNLQKEWENTAIETTFRVKREDFFRQLRISSSLNLKIPNGTKPLEIREYLFQKYHLDVVEENWSCANWIVPNYGNIKLRISKGILKKASYRGTNQCVSLKKKDGARARFLEREGVHSNPNGDIKSEIPRVTHFLHTGEWKPTSYDFYSWFIGEEKARPNARALVKAYFMPMYFTNYKDEIARGNRIAMQVRSDMVKYKAGLKKEFPVEVGTVPEYQVVQRVFQLVSCKMSEIMGSPFGSEIFVFTTILESFAVRYISERYKDCRVFQIYDEIFTDCMINDMDDIYKKAAASMYNVYKKIKEEEEQEKVESEKIDAVDMNGCMDIGMDMDDIGNNITSIVDMNRTIVYELEDSTSCSSSSLIFESKQRGGQIGHENYNKGGYKLSEETKSKMRQPKSEETKSKMRQPKSEETKSKMRQPKSEETKSKMRQPKSEETKSKIKAATNRDAEYVAFVLTLYDTTGYKSLGKTNAKKAYIDNEVQKKFGSLSSTTLTKIRKLATSASKEK